MKYACMAGLALGLLAGCVTAPTPQNAEEFRKQIAQGAYGSEFETFVVKRPYKTVASVIKAKANECLNSKVAYESCRRSGLVGTSCNNYGDTYVPTIVDRGQKTEVHVQFNRSGEGVGSLYLGGKPPANGMYIVVADITPAENGNVAKVEIYGNQVQRSVPNAIRHWANGTNLGCPNFQEKPTIPGPARRSE